MLPFLFRAPILAPRLNRYKQLHLPEHADIESIEDLQSRYLASPPHTIALYRDYMLRIDMFAIIVKEYYVGSLTK